MDYLYLDYSASTPMNPDVLAAMVEVYKGNFGNPSSIHESGLRARKVVEGAREIIASRLGAKPAEVIFTGSGTESNNLAIFGALKRFMGQIDPVHAITSSIEHPAVLHCFAELEKQGVEVTYLPVNAHGVVNPEDVRAALRPTTKLVSVMLVNNEIGSLQPLREIADICQAHKVLLHTDAVQAVGKVPVHFNDLGVDLLTFSGHKIYGPKGVGVLLANRKSRLMPILFGGEQEKGLRPATENVAAIHGMSVALLSVLESLEQESKRIEGVRDAFLKETLALVPDIMVTTGESVTVPNILHFSIADVLGEAVLLNLDRVGIHISAGAACSAGNHEPSHVMQTLKLPARFIYGSVRVSFGKDTEPEDAHRFATSLKSVVENLRKMRL